MGFIRTIKRPMEENMISDKLEAISTNLEEIQKAL